MRQLNGKERRRFTALALRDANSSHRLTWKSTDWQTLDFRQATWCLPKSRKSIHCIPNPMKPTPDMSRGNCCNTRARYVWGTVPGMPVSCFKQKPRKTKGKATKNDAERQTRKTRRKPTYRKGLICSDKDSSHPNSVLLELCQTSEGLCSFLGGPEVNEFTTSGSS